MQSLNDIKTYLLSKYTQFNVGYANVVKLQDSDILLDEDKQLYAGIEDTKGNYFYVRELKTATYDPMKRGVRVAYYKKTMPCRIVAVMVEGNADVLLKMLINGITAKRHFVTDSQTEATTVFKEETGKNLTRKEMTIVSVDFEIIDIVTPKECSLNPCNC